MRLLGQFQACLFISFFTKRFRADKNTSQAKTNKQNEIKQTKTNRGNNFFACTKAFKRVEIVFFFSSSSSLHFGAFSAQNLFAKKN